MCGSAFSYFGSFTVWKGTGMRISLYFMPIFNLKKPKILILFVTSIRMDYGELWVIEWIVKLENCALNLKPYRLDVEHPTDLLYFTVIEKLFWLMRYLFRFN